jgi:hypothetical protein
MYKQHALIPALLAAFGCGASDTPTLITPTLSISSPSDNSTVTLPTAPAPKLVSVTFQTNWNLRTQGECGADSKCGHINVLIDSSTCNDEDNPYNVQAIVSPAQADFGKCPTPTGQRTVTLELHDDDGEIVMTPLGDAVTAEVTVVAQ